MNLHDVKLSSRALIPLALAMPLPRAQKSENRANRATVPPLPVSFDLCAPEETPAPRREPRHGCGTALRLT